MKFFLYARKSTDDEERQILSIEAQLAELKEFAAKEKLEIAASFTEAKTAKEPGRMKFGEMLDRIEAGEADGILSWHPDRLARNSIDGGKIIYLVDKNKIKSLKFPTFWFENTPQGKFMLNIAFGQSKYYIDNLSENVKRGLRQKLRRGEYPGKAPIGYLHDRFKKTIHIDKTKAKFIKKLFEIYATGEYSLKYLQNQFKDFGLVSRRGYSPSISMIQYILTQPFYYGVFKYNREIYQGQFEPIITKKLFDKVQAVMQNRGKPHKKKKHDYIFTNGYMKCGACGACITAEKQKGHIYYRCTKKKGACAEKYIREEELAGQLIDITQKVSLPDDWADFMIKKLDQEKLDNAQSSFDLVAELKQKVFLIDEKLDKLLDSHLENIISKEDYVCKKEKLINEKISITERIDIIQRQGNNWLEPMRDFILSSKLAKKTADIGDLYQIKAFLKNIGSNFILQGKKFGFLAKPEWGLALNWGLIPNRLRIVNSVRTIIQQQNQYIYIPDLSPHV